MGSFLRALLTVAITVGSTSFVSTQERVRHNRVVSGLEGGETLHGVIIRNRTVETGRMLRTSGLDFVIVDMEHEAYDFSAIEDVMLGLHEQPYDPGLLDQVGEREPVRNSPRPPLARQSVPVPMVKIARFGREHVQFEVRHALKLGALGVFVPYAESRAEIEAAVLAATEPESHYVPRFSTEDWRARSRPWPLAPDGEFLVGAMIESHRGEENIDEILSTPGLGVLWLAHPSSAEVARAILEKCRERDIVALVGSADLGRWQVERNTGRPLLVHLGWDTDLFYRGLDATMGQLDVKQSSQP